ncbi:hypothetical protein E2C01_056049 [Portunus trituberculatus]|uniref:Uncharacterized protein n=1 Tax=Portunus trituberculatus TaxID=210409 RepID=A0A5B7GPC2_PORTR|nr:hypothetical protein [Portunus trituberculatus]
MIGNGGEMGGRCAAVEGMEGKGKGYREVRGPPHRHTATPPLRHSATSPHLPGAARVCLVGSVRASGTGNQGVTGGGMFWLNNTLPRPFCLPPSLTPPLPLPLSSSLPS